MGELILRADDLLSKWGFHDGDIPDGFLDYCDEQGLTYPDDWHAILRGLVRTHLLPVLDQDVKVYDIETNHNPIRAEFVDGREVDDYGDNPGIVLTPEYVTVPYEKILVAASAAAPA